MTEGNGAEVHHKKDRKNNNGGSKFKYFNYIIY